VLLSAGAIGLPHLLMSSGIGPAEHLRQVGVPLEADLPDVGQGLQDHCMAICLFDAQGGACEGEDVCGEAPTFEDVAVEEVLEDPVRAEIEVASAPYSGSELPSLIDIESAPDGQAKVCITAGDPAAPLMDCVEFQKQGEEDLAINGAPCGLPTADAGADAVAECSSPAGATVTLDGSGSNDPDSTPGTNDDLASFEWIEHFGLPAETLHGEGEMLAVTLPIGSHVLTLRVRDHAGNVATDEVVVAVADTTPPVMAVMIAPAELWPPNHWMVGVTAAVTASDTCSDAAVVLESIASSEPDDAPGSGDGSTVDDIQGASTGTLDVAFDLRAERSGAGPGRVYQVTYHATDAAGNSGVAIALVRVPLEREGGGGSVWLGMREDAVKPRILFGAGTDCP